MSLGSRSTWLIVGIIVLIVALLIWEYLSHDCINGKNCWKKVPPPNPDDPIPVQLDKIYEMVKNNYSYVSWRQSLIVGLIVALPVGYFLRQRIPTFFEWFIITLIVFFGVYFSYSWIWAHFLYPNGRQLERNLMMLRDIYSKDSQPPGGQRQRKMSSNKKGSTKMKNGLSSSSIQTATRSRDRASV